MHVSMESMTEKICDVFIIGGGINGVGIAADAAGRGLKVILCEKNDLASGTSSHSSKLIHGGLRYLQYFDFKLVHESLREQARLLKNAPQLVTPLTFVLPYKNSKYPQWLIHLGLFMYGHLAKRGALAKTKKISLKQSDYGNPLDDSIQNGFTYLDCYADDARLVILNALQAAAQGATILPRTEFVTAKRLEKHWEITVKNNGKEKHYQARILINAAGPWVETIFQDLNIKTPEKVFLVKGSHIVVPKLFEGDQAYILQTKEQRVVFVIPFEENYHLIGTTDLPFDNDPSTATIENSEIVYLQDIVNQYFKIDLKTYPIVWNYSGVRALINKRVYSPSAISRDFRIEFNKDAAPLMSVFGGKLTTYRLLAEKAVDQLREFFPKMKPAWTKNAVLPGGNIEENFELFLSRIKEQFKFLDEGILFRYAKNYGTNLYHFLKNRQSIAAMGQHFGHGLYQCEVDYLLQYEWAAEIDDILWRRSKLGLVFSDAQKTALKAYLLRLKTA